MAEKSRKKASRKTRAVKSLPPKAVTAKEAKGVKGGTTVNCGTGMSKSSYDWIK